MTESCDCKARPGPIQGFGSRGRVSVWYCCGAGVPPAQCRRDACTTNGDTTRPALGPRAPDEKGRVPALFLPRRQLKMKSIPETGPRGWGKPIVAQRPRIIVVD